jgi:hypothetical protein
VRFDLQQSSITARALIASASAYPDISKSNFEISKFDFELF